MTEPPDDCLSRILPLGRLLLPLMDILPSDEMSILVRFVDCHLSGATFLQVFEISFLIASLNFGNL